MLDEHLRALADKRRRRLLSLLTREDNAEISIDTIVNEHGNPDDPDRVHVSLCHCHLPKLDRIGLISWDRERGVFKKGPYFDDISPIIESIQKIENVDGDY